MPASKNGNNIWVTGTGNTLATVYSDIADPTFFDNPSAGVYELVGNRYLYILSGGELTIGNESDYSTSERLQFSPTSHGGANFTVQHGGALYNYGNTEIRLQTATYVAYLYFYGKLYWRGNGTYNPKVTKWRQNYFMWTSTSPASATYDIWDLEYVDFEDAYDNASFALLFSVNFNAPEHSFNYVTFNGYPGGTGTQYRGGYCIRVSVMHQNRGDRIVFDNCVFERVRWALNIGYGLGLAIRNSEVRNCINQGLQMLGQTDPPYYVSAQEPHSIMTGWEGQQFTLLDNVDFSNNSDYDIYARLGSVVAIKDCALSSTGDDSLLVEQGGRVLIWTGNTFADTFDVNPPGSVFNVHALDLTVEDDASNPIEDAAVLIVQKDGKENWAFRTDSSGKPITHPLMDGKVLLVHKEWISGDPVSGTFELWSDSGNSTYHTLIVAVPGYTVHSEQIEMSTDRARTVQLSPESPGRLLSRTFVPAGRVVVNR